MAEQVTGQRPVILTANCIVNGQFIRAGDPTPYTSEEDLPAAMRPFVATGDEVPFDPGERDLYDWSPGQRRQIRRLEKHAAHQEFAEQVASEPLRPDVQAALEASHELHIGAALKQAEVNQRLRDAAYEAAQPAEPRQLFVRRGGAWGHVERCRLKPGALIFARTPAGEFEVVGRTNSNAEIPNELTYDIQT